MGRSSRVVSRKIHALGAALGRRLHAGGAVLFIVALLLSPAAAQIPAVPKLVFAHYMVCCPRYGQDAKVAQFEQEISYAQQRKLDGFALNIGSWFKEAYYRRITEGLFAAADQLNSGFLLIFSPDHLTAEETADFIKTFGSRESYFKLNGKPVVSSYGGDPDWAAEVRRLLKQAGIEIVLVPCWDYTRGDLRVRLDPRKTLEYRIFDRAISEAPGIDGFFNFGVGDTVKNEVASTRYITQKLKALGKISMMGVAPYYKGFGVNSRVFEYDGFSGMAEQWRAAIEAGVDWVEIVTWNDWGEASYVAPFGAAEDQDLWNYHWGPLLAHDKYLDASAYYIDWFKTGVKPQIKCDRIFYFYRIHQKDRDALVDLTTGATGRPAGWQALDDKIFFSTFVKRELSASLSVGSATQSLEFPKGVANLSVPMSPGKIQIEVKDHGRLVARKTLEFPITDDAKRGNFNYFAGEVRLDHAAADDACSEQASLPTAAPR
jgi:hypothetical protein